MFTSEERTFIAAEVTRQVRANTQVVLHPPILQQTSQESVGGTAAASTTFPLKIVKADTSSVAKVTVTAGYIAGYSIAALTITLGTAGTYYVQAKVTVGYTASVGLWVASACGVPAASNSLTAANATEIWVNLGNAIVVSNGTGGYRCSAVNPAVIGSQAVARIGNLTTYSDYIWA